MATTRQFIDRALDGLLRAWRLRVNTEMRGERRAAADLDSLRRQIDDCLAARGGEASARARAAELGQSYLNLDEAGRIGFLELLAHDYGVAPAEVDRAVEAWRAAQDEAARALGERRLRQVLVAPRIRLLAQFNVLPEGVKFLVDLRASLMALATSRPEFRAFDAELRELLASWFDIGFLDLRRITWQAPASLLEKLIAYEAVHAIRSWDDLKNRLDSDRRCYAFFHPSMPEEPLIFVEVALLSGLADNVQALLDETAPRLDPQDADTAVFYSISNAQSGLAGVSLGDFLIKQVVDALARDLPRLTTFATLSPLPGFVAWLAGLKQSGAENLFLAAEARALVGATGVGEPHAAMLNLLARDGWPDDPAAVAALKAPLLRLSARFLTLQRQDRRAADRVAHFHLSNGARLERINWLSDRSANGLRHSAGIMVNYLYRLGDIEQNHEAYRGEGRVIASAAVERLAAG